MIQLMLTLRGPAPALNGGPPPLIGGAPTVPICGCWGMTHDGGWTNSTLFAWLRRLRRHEKRPAIIQMMTAVVAEF